MQASRGHITHQAGDILHTRLGMYYTAGPSHDSSLAEMLEEGRGFWKNMNSGKPHSVSDIRRCPTQASASEERAAACSMGSPTPPATLSFLCFIVLFLNFLSQQRDRFRYDYFMRTRQ